MVSLSPSPPQPLRAAGLGQALWEGVGSSESEGQLPTLLCTLGLPGIAISTDPGREQAGARLGQELIPSTAIGPCMSTHT